MSKRNEPTYYVPIWIARDPKTGDSSYVAYLFKFDKPRKNKIYTKKYGIMTAGNCDDISTTRCDPTDTGKGITVDFTKSGLKDLKNYIHHTPIFKAEINRVLRMKKLYNLIIKADYQLANEFLDLTVSGELSPWNRRASHLIRTLNREYYYLKPQNIDTIINYQKLNTDNFDSYCDANVSGDNNFLLVEGLDEPTYNHLLDEENYALWHDSNKQFLDKIKMLKPLLHN